ncbi:DUF1772 domain-containing protein [Streptomyces sp. OF3]|uniref:DUF1772 domain-containing protein n=1 Tax=Streptomyces alkaliterrae TaxID=2213162 RepID=A0A7W3WNE2_9ACTN|nr:DUF1772 domain-containing protein [Streptomyces alkaliterrae]MBB1255587.1 DUF1772 domain-containing protein [Streptomyces alkaliterrae]
MPRASHPCPRPPPSAGLSAGGRGATGRGPAPTAVVNVPLNERLDRAAGPADAAEAAALWAAYAPRWTRRNHVRALAATLSVPLTGAGLLLLP